MIIVRNLNDLSRMVTIGSHSAQVNAIVVLKNSDLATGSSDRTIKIWKSMYGDRSLSDDIIMDFLVKINNDKYASSINNNLQIRKNDYSLDSSTLLTDDSGFNLAIKALTFFNAKIVAGLNNGKLALADSSLSITYLDTGSTSPVVDLKNTTDYLVSVFQDRTVKIFDTNINIPVQTFNLDGDYASMIFFKYLGLTKPSLCITTYSKTITVYTNNFLPSLTRTASELQLNSVINVMTVLTNGNLVVGCKDGSISVYDPNSLNRIYYFKNHSSEIKGLLVHPALDYLVSASADGLIQMWDPITFELRVLINNTERITSLYYFNYELVAIREMSKKPKIWYKSPELLSSDQTLVGHTDAVLDLALLNNGFLASSSKDRTIKIWDNNLKNIVNVTQAKQGHTKAILALKVLNNNNLVSTSEDRTAKIWATDLFVKYADLQ